MRLLGRAIYFAVLSALLTAALLIGAFLAALAGVSHGRIVAPDHRLGNVRETPIGDLVLSEKQRRFGQAKYDTLPQYCRACPVLFACYGECPRNRFIRTPDGEDGLNYLCAGYKAFFQHIEKPMRTMADLVRKGRYADEIMEMQRA